MIRKNPKRSIENGKYEYIHNPWNHTYSVGEVCSVLNVTRKTLFYYDKIGLLVPVERKGVQKFKYYDERQLERLKKILKYRSAGLNISEIRSILDDAQADHLQILEEAMNRLLSERDKKVQEITNLQAMIDLETEHE